MESIINLDEQLFVFINKTLCSGILDTILIPIRHKLFWLPLYLFIIVFISVNYGKTKWWVFLFFGVTILLSDTVSSKIIKKSVERVRPCHVERLEPLTKIHCSHGFSFTSSHATNHFAIGTFLVCLLSFYKYRFLWFVWAGIISFAQVYVGVHYPFDVLTGGLIGIILGLLSFRLYTISLNQIKTRKANVV